MRRPFPAISAGSAISALKSVSAASSAPSRPEIADHAQHLLMKPIVGGDEVSGGGVERRAVHAGDSSCRLLHDQRTGGHVPGLEMLFPEAVEPSRGHVAEIQRGGSKTPDATRTAEELTEERDEIAGVLVNVVWKAGDEQRLEQRLGG